MNRNKPLFTPFVPYVSQYEKREFYNQYMETAIWSSNDTEDDTPVEYHLTDGRELSTSAKFAMARDCVNFMRENYQLIDDCLADYSQAGHDFWLTRCGHGAGFWDGQWPVNGNELTAASKIYGNVDLYVGDDGKVYQ